MLAIFKKEIRGYFTSFIGYVFVALFLGLIGLYFYINNILSGSTRFETVLDTSCFAFMILIPAITMRVMAEENHQKTDQLLLTAPVSTKSIILGKYMALMAIFGTIMLVSCMFPLFLTKYGAVNLKSAYAAILGYYLLGGTFMAVGLFVSTCTENQLVACAITFVIVLLTNLADGIASLFPSDNRTGLIVFSIIFLLLCGVAYLMMRNIVVVISIAAIGEAILTILYVVKPTVYDGLIVKVFSWFSVTSRFTIFAGGILDVSAILYYLSFIFVFLFLAIQCLNKRRWS